jgi:ribosomal protein S18 acetylase RimI-like enzyme
VTLERQINGIKQLEREIMDRATITLERAFSTDPMFSWIFPDPTRRPQSLQRFNRVPLEYGLRYGHVTQVNDGRAIAIWLPPGRTVTMGGMVRSGMLPIPFQVGFRPFAKFMNANETMERIHKRYAPEPHWYLLVIGVDPELQGHGLGTALVKEGLARADQANCPCYLETSAERNLPFYERCGFKVVESASLGDGGPTAWGMRRDPLET